MSGLYRIPRTWNWATFQDIAEVVTGNTPPTSNAENYGGEVPFFKPPQLNNLPVGEAPETLSEIGLEKARLLPAKSVLVSCIGILGKTAITKNFSATNQQINAVIFDPHILPEYGFYYSQTLAPWLKENSSATTVAIINKGKFEVAPFPLPPANEQTRIVKKLEELLSDLDAGVAELKAAQKKLEQYRQSLLKAAVEGKLTQHWREQRSVLSPSPQPLSHKGRGAFCADGINDAAASYQPHHFEKKATLSEQNPNLRNALPSNPLPSPLVGEGLGERGQSQSVTLQQNPNLSNTPPSQSLPSPLAGEGLGERGQAQSVTLQQNPVLRNAPPSKTLPSPLAGEEPGERGQEQSVPFETGAELLQRILTERRARWEAKQLAKFKEQGKTPPKDWQSKYPGPVKPDTTDLPELPEGWVWASVEQIASDERYSLSIGPFGSNLRVPDYREAGVPLVFVRNIRSGNYGGAYTKYVTLEKAGELSAHSVSAGDVLITKMGEPPGDADVYPDDQPPAIITADCIKVRCWGGLMRPEFLKSVINSYIGQRQIEPMTQGVAQKKVSLGRFTNLAVPIPSIQEQDRIMEMVSVANAEAVAQEAAIEISLKQSAAQRKNILKAAFSGQLVPQDPNDEPASVLLGRIRNQRQLVKPPAKRSRL